jgi:hypothetical protein
VDKDNHKQTKNGDSLIRFYLSDPIDQMNVYKIEETITAAENDVYKGHFVFFESNPDILVQWKKI